MSAHELDNAAWHAMTSRMTHLADLRGAAALMREEIAPFAGLPLEPSAADWDDLAALLGDRQAALFSAGHALPEGWVLEFGGSATQMVAPAGFGRMDAGLVVLGEEHVPQMLALTAATQPGPFAAEARRMGTYLGILDGDRLVAMGGERLQSDAWVEVSAVCTDPDYRGRGYASAVLRGVVAGIEASGRGAYLHVSRANPTARRLYETLGFTVRAESLEVQVVRAPGSASGVAA